MDRIGHRMEVLGGNAIAVRDIDERTEKEHPKLYQLTVAVCDRCPKCPVLW